MGVYTFYMPSQTMPPIASRHWRVTSWGCVDVCVAGQLEASSQLEVGLYRLKTELNERLTKINVGVK